jgi:hypothetical protein
MNQQFWMDGRLLPPHPLPLPSGGRGLVQGSMHKLFWEFCPLLLVVELLVPNTGLVYSISPLYASKNAIGQALSQAGNLRLMTPIQISSEGGTKVNILGIPAVIRWDVAQRLRREQACIRFVHLSRF